LFAAPDSGVTQAYLLIGRSYHAARQFGKAIESLSPLMPLGERIDELSVTQRDVFLEGLWLDRGEPIPHAQFRPGFRAGFVRLDAQHAGRSALVYHGMNRDVLARMVETDILRDSTYRLAGYAWRPPPICGWPGTSSGVPTHSICAAPSMRSFWPRPRS